MGEKPEAEIPGDQPPGRVVKLDIQRLDRVVEIAAESFEKPWARQDFAYFLTHQFGFNLGFLENENSLSAYLLGLLVEGGLDIVSIAVEKKSRRKGMSTTLINYAKTLPSVKKIFVEVAVDNESAISLYKTLGFVVTSRVPKYYEGRTDAFRMVLS